jgi:hypothetical protein
LSTTIRSAREGAKRFHESLFVELVEAWRTPFNTATPGKSVALDLEVDQVALGNGVVPMA